MAMTVCWKCDICGAVADERLRPEVIEPVRVKPWWQFGEWDICPACAEEVHAFLGALADAKKQEPPEGGA